MSRWSGLKRWWQKQSQAVRQALSRLRRRLELEALEDRTVPVVTVLDTMPTLSGGTMPTGTTTLQVQFSEPVLGGNLSSNYELRNAGPDGLLGTGDDGFLALTPNYSGTAATLTFPALAEGIYRLTVQDSITDGGGSPLDGDNNGIAGGDYVREFVVGPISYTLTSPNGFTFDTEFGGWGAGQLVQGTGNAFDGLNRLQVGGSDYVPSIPTIPTTDAYQAVTTNPFQMASTTYADIPQLSITFTADGGPVRFAVPVRHFADNTTQVFYRFMLDGSQIASAFEVLGSEQSHYELLLPSGIVSPGTHTLKLQVRTGESGDLVQIPIGSRLLIQEFNTIPGAGPTTDVYQAVTTNPFQMASTTYADIPQLSITFTADGGPVRFAVPVRHFADNTTQVFYRFMLDGSQIASAFEVLGSEQSHYELLLPSGIVSPGTHTLKLQVRTGESGDLVQIPIGSRLLIQEFNTIPGAGPTTDVYQAVTTNPFQMASTTYADIPQLSITFTADGGPVRFAVPVRHFADNTTQVFYRFMLDGSQIASAFEVLGSEQSHYELLLPSGIVSPGTHTLKLQVRTGESGDLVQIPIGSRLLIQEFNTLAWPVLDDSNRTIITPAQVLSGLNVSREITVPNTGSEDFARTVDVFHNPTGSAITVPVRYLGNLGTDDATTVFMTSDGDTILETTDLWVATDDGDGSGAPATVHFMHGPLGLQPTAVIRSGDRGDNIEWTYDLTVDAGQTVRLAHFTIQHANRAGAIAAANALVTPTGFGGQAAAFLTQGEIDSIRNFAFNLAPTDILLSNDSLPENAGANFVIGDFSTTDPNVGDSHTYSLVTGTGDDDNAAFNLAGNQLRANASFDFEGQNSFSIRVRTTDAGGLFFDEVFTITVTNVNESPIADAGGPYTVAEGEGLTLDASGSFDPDGDMLDYFWDINGDNTFDDASGVSPTLTWAQLIALGLSDGPATFDVWVRVDDGGGLVDSLPTTLTLNNAAPFALSLDNNGPISEGGTATVSLAGVSDPSPVDSASLRFSFALTAGGLAADYASASTTNSAAFSFPDDGSYTVFGRVYDKDGGISSTFQTTVVVNNVPPTVTSFTITGGLDGNGFGTAGSPISFLAAASDPGTQDTFTYQFDWNYNGITFDVEDTIGPVGPAGRSPQGISHTYFANGLYQPAVRVLDEDGGTSAIFLGPTVNVGTGTVFMVDGNLIVNGTNGNDNISVNTYNLAAVTVHRNGTNHGPFDLSGGGRVIVRALAGADVVSLNGPVSGEVFGGTGNDFLYGGSGHDQLHGEDGNDYLSLGAGHDVGIGGLGRDMLYGGNGDDVLLGGQVDSLVWDWATLQGVSSQWSSYIGPNGTGPAVLGSLAADTTDPTGTAEQDRFWGNTGKDAFLYRAGTGGDLVNDYSLAAKDYLLALT